MTPERLATLADNAVAFDTETHLIQPGLLAPPLVCGSMATTGVGSEIHSELMSKDYAREWFPKWLAADSVIIVGANIAYDMLVMAVDAARRGIDLMPAIFAAYDQGRVFDIQIAEALHAIGLGMLGRHPVTGETLRGPDGKPTGRYSLHTCTELVLGRSNAKANDRYRLSYALLEDTPIDQWPEEARTYPVDDAVNTLEVALAQVTPGTDGRPRNLNLHDVATQTYKAWALHLGAAWGLRTDPAGVQILASVAERLQAEGAGEFSSLGYVRPDGSEDQAVVKRAVAVAYGCTGGCTNCGASGKVPSPTTGKPINCATCNATGLDLNSAPVPRTAPTAKFPHGQVQIGRDTLIETGDEALMSYGAHQEDEKILSTYIPFLKEGATAPICLRPNAVLETGRVSYSGPIQLLPRQVSARLSGALKACGAGVTGVRDCFAARPGSVFYSVDYSGGELVTFAEACVARVGFSKMGESLNTGADVHSALAASFVGMKYEDFIARRKERRLKDLRQAAKPINFGCPGGIGPVKIVLQQRKQGPDTPCPGGPSVVSDGAGGFTEGYKGLRFCILVDGATSCGHDKVTTWGKDMQGDPKVIPPTCRACILVATRLRDGWFATWPEAKPYLDWHKENVRNHGAVVQLYSDRMRGGTDFCSEANGDFQALLADIAGRAQIRVCREQYAVASSPLYGSRGIGFFHDELFGECRREVGHEVCQRVVELMVDEFRKGCPNHQDACKAEPTIMARWWKAGEPVWVDGRLMPWEPK